MNKRIIKSFALLCVALILAGCGYYLVRHGKKKKSFETVFLTETGNIDYEICLKDNEFITKKCLSKEDKENTYIASLIDYMNLNYDYNINFDKEFSGSYTYNFKAIIRADKSDSNNSNYFTKEFILTDSVTKDFNNIKTVNINDSISVGYDYYNDILNNFKYTYGIVMDGKLDVILEATILYWDESLDRQIMKTVSLPVTIPLTSQVVEIPITSDKLNNKEEIYSKELTSYGKSYLVYKAFGYTSFVLSALFILWFFKYSIKYAVEVSEYTRKLKKILRMYDGIIVNVSQAPDLGKNVIIVSNFEELIDAHSEVRMPINFVEKSNSALFYLSSNNQTWVYELKQDIDD